MTCPLEGNQLNASGSVTSKGLIQSVLQYLNLFCKLLTGIGFKQSPVDPCLFSFKNALQLTSWCWLYMWMILDLPHALIDFLLDNWKTSVEHDLTAFLSCDILFNKSRTKAWLGQPYLTDQEIENTFCWQNFPFAKICNTWHFWTSNFSTQGRRSCPGWRHGYLQWCWGVVACVEAFKNWFGKSC